MTLGETKTGVVMATAAYMSPEQAEGKPTDKRSDIWSFGVVLYETLSGKRCFEGRTTSHVLVHILEQEPDWQALPASAPVGVRLLLERCLTKDPAERLRDIGDVRVLLRALEKEAKSASKSGRVAAVAEAASSPAPAKANRVAKWSGPRLVGRLPSPRWRLDFSTSVPNPRPRFRRCALKSRTLATRGCAPHSPFRQTDATWHFWQPARTMSLDYEYGRLKTWNRGLCKAPRARPAIRSGRRTAAILCFKRPASSIRSRLRGALR